MQKRPPRFLAALILSFATKTFLARGSVNSRGDLVSVFVTNTAKTALTSCLKQSWGERALRDVEQKLLCGGSFAITWLHCRVQAFSWFCHGLHFLAKQQASDPKHSLGDSLKATCQSVLQKRNLTHSYRLRPIYLKNQWAFKNSPAHISFSVMVVNSCVSWFCGLFREPWFSAHADTSIGKRKLTAFTLPLEENERGLWGLEIYKTCKETQKKNQPKTTTKNS